MGDTWAEWWPTIGSALSVLCALWASVHVVLHKRDVRSAAGWVGLVWLVPLLGSALYLLLGINRVRRRAVSLRRGGSQALASHAGEHSSDALALHGTGRGHLGELSAAIHRVTQRTLWRGNHVQPLWDGDEAYPAMIAAIERAERSIAFCTYIFETKGIGAAFIDALVRAHARGVQVRVLIDGVGANYAWPRADRVLRRRGVRAALFMPARFFWRAPYFNLRNHRKILVVDGKLGFTGGANIRQSHFLSGNPREPARDLQFRLEGPVVAQLQEVFAEDWEYTTGEVLEGSAWFPQLAARGLTLARAIADGPDDDVDKFTWTLHAALACASKSVSIVTPYFLPDSSLTTALSTAALRGVAVHVMLPERSNLTLVQWAMTRQLEEVLGHGVRVWLSRPPFDHTKLMIVDGEWVLFGSANWDARSLRLNFELDVECYDRELALSLLTHVQARRSEARELLPEELLARPYGLRVRDGFVRLLAPYL
jgi:cardiolipin synthase